MAPDREHRVDSAINSLISHLVPSDQLDDEDAAQERHDECFDLVKAILERQAMLYTVCNATPDH